MKQEREALEASLTLHLNNLLNKGNKNRLIDVFTEELKDYVNRGKVIQLITLNLPLCSANTNELYNVVRIAKKFFDFNVVLEDYFTDSEMTNAINERIVHFDGILRFDNVLYNGNDLKPEWTCIISYEELVDKFNTGALTYNMETQRAGKMIKIGRDIVIIPTVNPESRNSIKREILINNFSTNMITLNITRNGKETNNVIYDEIENKLGIDTRAMECAIIDGMHRTLACVDAYEENPNIKGHFVLQIKNLTIQQAKNFIIQESKANKHNEDALELMDNTNVFTIFIQDLDTFANRDNNIFFNNININMDKHEFLIHDFNVKKGLIMAGWDNIISQNDVLKTDKVLKYITKFFTTFYKLADLDNQVFTDTSFFVGLFVTSYQMYQSNEFVDVEEIEKLVKKLNKNKKLEEYTFNLPIKAYEEKDIVKKFKDLI